MILSEVKNRILIMKHAIIKWIDSSRSCHEWTLKDDYQPINSPHAIISIGSIIHETLDCVTLAQNISDYEGEHEQYCHVMIIPRSSITDISRK
jgi:hypothetical protein